MHQVNNKKHIMTPYTNIKYSFFARKNRRNLIFISAGAREKFATYAINYLLDEFDVACFFYHDFEIDITFKKQCVMYANGSGTKFNALRELYTINPSFFRAYETIWICDDDLIINQGNPRILPLIVQNFGLKAISPSHAKDSKVSHEIMVTMHGSHFFRYTNFIEMGWPIFLANELYDFLEEYDGSLDGWGIDWWYLNFLKANHRPAVGIVDSLITINPFDHQKQGGFRELDLAINNQDQYRQWVSIKKQNNLYEWEMKNLFLTYAEN